MILIPHLLIGAVIATKIHPFALAAALALASHYVLDAVPHWDYSTLAVRQKRWKQSLPVFSKIALDFSLGMILIFLLAKNLLLAFTGVFFAVLPDGITIFVILFPRNKLLQKHHFLHDRICHWFRGRKIPLFWKILSQVLTMITALYFLVR